MEILSRAYADEMNKLYADANHPLQSIEGLLFCLKSCAESVPPEEAMNVKNFFSDATFAILKSGQASDGGFRLLGTMLDTISNAS